MATARVPKIVLTVNHASGAGYYAMAGQGFDPDFIFSWPTGPHGRDGGRGGGAGGARAGDRAGRSRRSAQLAPRCSEAIERDARRLRAPARRAIRGRARVRGCHRDAGGDPGPARLRAAGCAPATPARTWVRSSCRRWTRAPPAKPMRRASAGWPRSLVLACAPSHREPPAPPASRTVGCLGRATGEAAATAGGAGRAHCPTGGRVRSRVDAAREHRRRRVRRRASDLRRPRGADRASSTPGSTRECPGSRPARPASRRSWT